MSLAKRKIASYIILFILIGIAIAIWFNRQLLHDWFVVSRYTPPQSINDIATKAGMSDRGRFLFYASEPIVSDANTFNTQCNRKEAATAVLGCYADGRIYVYHVDSPELEGIEEVTAAHEMLHAAWDRLSNAERDRIGKILEREYQRVKTPTLEERMSYYERQQPGQRANELHSILGTEVGQLDEALERHYKVYFTDRQKIVALHNKYEAVFTALKDRAETLKRDLEQMAPVLNADIEQYNQAVEQLNQSITAHNQRLSTVDRTNTAEVDAYNIRRTQLISQQIKLDETRRQLDVRRETYDKKLTEYNKIAVRSETLTNSIDSLRSQKGVEE